MTNSAATAQDTAATSRGPLSDQRAGCHRRIRPAGLVGLRLDPGRRCRLSRLAVARRLQGCVRLRLDLFRRSRHDRIVGVLPTVLLDSWLFGRALISLPFVNYGGVLADDPVAERALLEAAAAAASEHRCKHLELRHIGRHFDDLPCKQHKVTMLLPLQQAPALWDGLDKKVRNQVRKAQKSGLTYQDGGLELLDAFYAVFARNMRDLGTPVYSRNFFAQILKAFPERARVHVVSQGSTPPPRGSRSRPIRPSKFRGHQRCATSMRCAPTRCCTGACSKARPGGDAPRSISAGRRRTKAPTGSRRSGGPSRCRCAGNTACSREANCRTPARPIRKFELAVSMWKRLPLPVANRFGPMIVRAIP